MIDREQIRQQFVEIGLAHVADEIAQVARPCIRLHTTAGNDDEIITGASKFGGLPDVPPEFAWPEWSDRPLAFLGQINLATIAHNPIAAPLPPAGLLSFFYDYEQWAWGSDPDDKGSWRIYLFPTQSLRRTASPVPLPDYANYRPCTLSFDDGLTFPRWDSLYRDPLHLTNEEWDQYIAYVSDYELESYGHQLLGFPKEIQGEMQLECQLASNGVNCGTPEGYQDPRVAELKAGAWQWNLLFQCDSDEKAGWSWGDFGRLYFWIKNADLEARQFENAWMILQCS